MDPDLMRLNFTCGHCGSMVYVAANHDVERTVICPGCDEPYGIKLEPDSPSRATVIRNTRHPRVEPA